MKKIVLVVLLVLGMAFPVFAEMATDSKVIYTYTIRSAAGGSTVTLIPVTTIYPGIDRVLGYSIMADTDGGPSERYIEVYDATTAGLSGEVIGESESTSTESMTVWFPYPRTVENGIAVRQGANSIATIYFVR